MPIRVLLVDDYALFRDGLARVLKADRRFDVVGEASRGDEAVAAAAELRPDLILIDLRMPGMTGTEAIRRIRASDPRVAIGVLTIFASDQELQSALDAGATGYVVKDSTPADFCTAALAIAQGQRGVGANPRPAETDS